MVFLFFLVLALFGMFAHWLKKWARDEIKVSYYQYMMGEKKNTLSAIISTVFGVFMSYHVGMDINQENISLFLLIGYGCDSLANKSPE